MQSNPREPRIEKRIESRWEACTALFQFRWMQNLVPGFPADLPGRFFPESFSLEGYSLPRRLSTWEFNAVSVFANTSKGATGSPGNAFPGSEREESK
jgi:hypothetical protein